MRHLKILYVGKLSGQPGSKAHSDWRRPYAVAQQTFEAAICDQLNADESIDLSSSTFALGSTFPKGALLVRGKPEGRRNHFLPYFNLPLLREFSLFTSHVVFGLAGAVRHQKPDIVLQLSNYAPIALGSRILAMLLGAKFVMTLTDLSDFTFRADRIARMPMAKRLLAGPYSKFASRVQRSADAYVLFAADMREKVGTSPNRSLVMEGMFNSRNLEMDQSPRLDRPIVAHAGTLDRKLGIPLLLDSFARIEDSSVELWMIGSGDMDSEIEHRASIDRRIRFFGFRPRPEVFQLLCQARLLVNLRDPQEEFTRYSFPSKIFEFLATGVPVASTRLRGIPDEYFDHMIPLVSREPGDIADAMEKILREPAAALRGRGQRGRQFVLDRKNPHAQTQRVIEFMRGL